MVDTQASLIKTFNIPKNLNPGEYIFGATTEYGSSFGTSTSLFDVTSIKKEEELCIVSLATYYLSPSGIDVIYLWDSFVTWFKNYNVLGIITLLVVIYLIISKKVSLFGKNKSKVKTKKGKEVEKKIKDLTVPPPKETKETKKEEKKVVKKEIKTKSRFKYKKLFLIILVIFVMGVIAYWFYSTQTSIIGGVTFQFEDLAEEDIGCGEFCESPEGLPSEEEEFSMRAFLIGGLIILFVMILEKRIMKNKEKFSK